MATRFFILLLPFFLFQKETMAQSISQVSGYVFNSIEPVANANVFLTNKGLETITDENGEFFFNGKFSVGEELELLILSEGYEPLQAEKTINSTDLGKIGILKLKSWRKKGFNILVREEGGSAVLQGVEIKANGKIYTTDDYGNVFIEVYEELQSGDKAAPLILKKEGFEDKVVSEYYAPGRTLLEITLKKKPCLSSVIDSLKMVFTDCRDGRTYKVREINGVFWMDENLKYTSDKSVFYRYDEGNRDYGRLYSWDEAQAACPDGWRLPTKSDFKNLMAYLGGKAKTHRFFESDPLMLGGRRDSNGHFMHKDKYGYFWSKTSQSESKAFYFGLGTFNRAYVYRANNSELMYCRCIKQFTEK